MFPRMNVLLMEFNSGSNHQPPINEMKMLLKFVKQTNIWGLTDSIGIKALTLHATKQDSFPRTMYGSLKTARSDPCA